MGVIKYQLIKIDISFCLYKVLAMSKRVRTQTDFYSPAGEGLMPDKWQDAWSPKEQALFENNNKAYEKEQKRRKLAGQTPIIICMGGPYSDAWYPPVP
jgi:hypothetical protein